MINKIKEVSTKVREILEQSNISDHHSCTAFSINEFPKGCCAEASKVLQHVLCSELGISTNYVTGIYRFKSEDESTEISGLSHAWLEFDNWIIDITADQFNNLGFNNLPVIVTNDRSFHGLFDENQCSIQFKTSDTINSYLLNTLGFVSKQLNSR